MFDADADHREQQLSQWAQGFADRAERFHTMRANLEQITVSESAAEGAVRVTVNSSGQLTDLAFTDEIRNMVPSQVAAQVMAGLRRAQQQLAPLVQETMLAAIGEEQELVEKVVGGYRESFGQDTLRPRAAPVDEQEYFADRDYLR
ncbi:MAG: YbaB/EbfC family nucleoid-associated protein [Pseudonocardiaceae bacterium]